jgi:hypothetical protein
MTPKQVADDVAAGLGFVVLKTVIAEDDSGGQTMREWAVPEARMVVEPITGRHGDAGWTVSWKGRGWSGSLREYCDFIRQARQLAAGTGTLIVPSCKYHLPSQDGEAWRGDEYRHTTQSIWQAWSETGVHGPMPIEKDFSPTLAGSDRADNRERILHWVNSVAGMIRGGLNWTPEDDTLRVGVKLFNALFDDDFQIEMLRAVHWGRPDFFIYGNRLFDPQRDFEGHRGIAYGGPDLSDRNLRIMSAVAKLQRDAAFPGPPLPWSATGDIASGRAAVAYALCGASSFQMHTFFQLPADQYRMPTGSKTARALHELYFHPESGFIVWAHHVAAHLGLDRAPLRLRDVITHGRELL